MAISFSYDEATNKVVVNGGTEGTPATFADFVTADRAGTDTKLLDAGSPANDLALTYAVRPVENKALKVKCVVANKTAETDYIFITGKDWKGDAQTESIDVSAGNGSYETTKYWSEITTLDCSDNPAGGGTIWADGDLTVTQDIWGVIWDYGDKKYRLDCFFDIGDGVASTYFITKNERVNFADGKYPELTANATLQMGELQDDWGYNGSTFDIKLTANKDIFSGGTFLMYDSKLKFHSNYEWRFNGGDLTFNKSTITGNSNTHWRCNFKFKAGTNSLSIKKLRLDNWNLCALEIVPSIFTEVHRHYGNVGFSCLGTITATDLLFSSITTEVATSSWNVDHFTVKNPKAAISSLSIGFAGSDIKEQYTCNIHIADKDGADLETVNVKCEDKDGNEIFSVNTGVDGKITEQVITYKKWEGTDETLTEYSPHKFTISKAGYEMLVLDEITVDKPIDWHLELLPALAEADVREATVFGENKTGTLDLPSVNDVEKGVQFDNLAKTGVLKVPAEANVRQGEGYGANDNEFTGELDLPAEEDVEKGVKYDNETKEGNFEAPAEADVKKGVGYGANSVEFEGDYEADFPAEEDVEKDVSYDEGAKVGKFHVPEEEDVEVGVGYGANGTEFEGTYLGLKGNNLVAYLQKSVDLVGYLENKVSLTGELKS